MNDYNGLRAVVVGGSIGGLTAALLLRDLGFTVEIYERSARPLSGRGSGIVLQPDTARWFTERSSHSLTDLRTSTRYVQYLNRGRGVDHREKRHHDYTAWGTFYRALLADFGSQHYHLGKQACGFSQSERAVTVRFDSGGSVTADLAVFADGISSTARRQFDPDAAVHYSGYVGWRGTHPWTALSDSTRETLDDAITFDVPRNSHVTMYPIPGEDGISPKHRLMNYVWYRNVDNDHQLAALLLDTHGRSSPVSVPPGLVQQRHIDELKHAAAEELSPGVAEVIVATKHPYLQVVSDVRSKRMAQGRVALIGDAAAAARPHAAAGTAKAAADAWALANALGDAGGDVAAALEKWEPAQLDLSASLTRRAIAMGQRFQVSNTATPGDPSLRFGLYGPGH
ncbi:FAD-dependent monooxygenase [Mycobacterium sp. Aquia_216]|uniref:FAD binding domain-containing protein n=1 Tax=Mycobacterium sp. Aquia_216 TaxID=2991729 RepID=UPI00227B13D1|nr:FAD-dependent monooxygenase [Mycobacterium sp. Aquia_216]WAJ45311.1 FAD-dependent monooxygenase [Mycobacterium sp. Aquia_216]